MPGSSAYAKIKSTHQYETTEMICQINQVRIISKYFIPCQSKGRLEDAEIIVSKKPLNEK
jgi:hypothetical protein